jgi:hypothetical protein
MNRTQIKGSIHQNLSQILQINFNDFKDISLQLNNQNVLDENEINILIDEVNSLLFNLFDNIEFLDSISSTDLTRLNNSLNTINNSISQNLFKTQKNIFAYFESLRKEIISSGLYYKLLNPSLENLSKINEALKIGNEFLSNKSTFEKSLKLFKDALESKEDYDVNLILNKGQIFGDKAKEHKPYIEKQKCKLFFLKNINTFWWLIFAFLFGFSSLFILYYFVIIKNLDFNTISFGGAIIKISSVFIPSYFAFYCINQYSNHRRLYEFYMQKQTSVAALSDLYKTYPSFQNQILEKALNIIFSEMSDKGEIKNSSNEDLISLIKAFIAKERTS